MAWTGTYAFLQCTVAMQELLDASGNIVKTPVATGTKITFCFVDVEFIGNTGSQKKATPRTYWECNGDLQGLASQWADSYHQLNNFTWLKFRLERNGSNLSIVELEHSECGHPAQCGSGGNP